MAGKHVSQELVWTDEHALPGELARIDQHSITIVDFDETLWLRNSTEEFLAHVRPRILASLLLQILGFLKPWRIAGRTNARHHRDWVRVGSIVLFMPWSLLTWRKAARHLGPRYANQRLRAAISSSECPAPVHVASFGFQFIVSPLLSAIDEKAILLLCSPVWRGANLRQTGKAAALHQAIGPDVLKRAIFVTDSAEDADLKNVCGHPFFTKWTDAEYRQAGNFPMLPLAYTSKVKRPDENYILHGIVGYDLLVGLLAYAVGSPAPFVTAIAFAIYLLGFFAVYEIGYFENDTYAAKREKSPKLSATFATFGENYSPRWAWVFGILLLGIGAAVQTWSGGLSYDRVPAGFVRSFFTHWALAIALVIATRLTFFVFNSMQPRHRIIPMLGLQLQRTLGYALFLPITWVGAMLCICHAFARWVPYVIYRYGGSRDRFPAHLCALLFFLTFGGVTAAATTDPWDSATYWQMAAIVVYLVIRAAKDAVTFIRRPEG